MKHILTITGDNYNEVISNIKTMYKKGVFDYFVLEKDKIENKLLSYVANVIIKSVDNVISSPFDNIIKNRDNSYYVCVDDNGVFFVYTTDKHLVDKFTCVKENRYWNSSSDPESIIKDKVKSITDKWIADKNKEDIFSANDLFIAQKVMKLFMDNSNKLMDSDTIREEIGFKKSIDDTLIKMEHRGILRLVYFNNKKCYQLKVVNVGINGECSLNLNDEDTDTIIKKMFNNEQKKAYFDLNEIDKNIVRMFVTHGGKAMDKDTISKNTGINSTLDVSLHNLVDKGILLVGSYMNGKDIGHSYWLKTY